MKAILCLGALMIACAPANADDAAPVAAPWAGNLVIDANTEIGIEDSLGSPAKSTPFLKVQPIPTSTGSNRAVPIPTLRPTTTVDGTGTTVVPKTSKKRVISGNASFYKDGRVTANGERFLPLGFTAAHRSLPFGTKLLVTNKKTGRSVLVRINDRGPFIGGRVLDLTLGAARAIGLEQYGVASVTMEIQ